MAALEWVVDLALDVFDIPAYRSRVEVAIQAERCAAPHPGLEPGDMRASDLTPPDVRVPVHLDIELTVAAADRFTVERLEAEVDGQLLGPSSFRPLAVPGNDRPAATRFELVPVSGRDLATRPAARIVFRVRPSIGREITLEGEPP